MTKSSVAIIGTGPAGLACGHFLHHRFDVTDIHLHRVRLFFREAKYPWNSPQADLAEVRRLIEKHGYWRRKEELEEAEAATRNWPGSTEPTA